MVAGHGRIELPRLGILAKFRSTARCGEAGSCDGGRSAAAAGRGSPSTRAFAGARCGARDLDAIRRSHDDGRRRRDGADRVLGCTASACRLAPRPPASSRAHARAGPSRRGVRSARSPYGARRSSRPTTRTVVWAWMVASPLGGSQAAALGRHRASPGHRSAWRRRRSMAAAPSAAIGADRRRRRSARSTRAGCARRV
jgi:hypothetical protein